MSKMKDMWGDTIEVRTKNGCVIISFGEPRVYTNCQYADMELDAKKLRKFIKKLNKALAEVEDM